MNSCVKNEHPSKSSTSSYGAGYTSSPVGEKPSAHDRWTTYQRDFGSIKKSIILERVFDVPSRFAAVCQLHFAFLDQIGRRYDIVSNEPNALWQAQLFTNKHPSTARITSRDLDWEFIHYERPSFVSQELLGRPEWDLLLHEPSVL